MHIRTLFVVELVPDIKTAQAYETNRIFIPEIGVNEEIIETDSIKNVHDKVWHRPDTGTPPLGGNTVMVAHRYANIGGDRASTFYDLPKLKPNDVVTIWWEGVEYKYSVFETEIVEPDNVGVEAPTQESILTLYTCTPLWSATHRYVVRAKLIN